MYISRPQAAKAAKPRLVAEMLARRRRDQITRNKHKAAGARKSSAVPFRVPTLMNIKLSTVANDQAKNRGMESVLKKANPGRKWQEIHWRNYWRYPLFA